MLHCFFVVVVSAFYKFVCCTAIQQCPSNYNGVGGVGCGING